MTQVLGAGSGAPYDDSQPLGSAHGIVRTLFTKDTEIGALSIEQKRILNNFREIDAYITWLRDSVDWQKMQDDGYVTGGPGGPGGPGDGSWP